MKKRIKGAAKAALKEAGGIRGLAEKVDQLALRVASDKPGPAERVGRKLGGALGFSGLGGVLGKTVGRIIGTGDYTFDGQVNSLFKPEQPMAGFRSRQSHNSVRVRRVEFLQPVFASSTAGAFRNDTIAFNPGNPRFPWLSSSVAMGYEKYVVHGAAVVLRSTYSEGTTGSVGVWGVAFDYNLSDPPYASKAEAEQSEGAVFTKPSKDILAGIECAPNQTAQEVKIIRFTPLTGAVLDIGQTDHCNIEICSQGVPTASAYLGDAWIVYDIELFAPEVNGGFMGGGCYNFVLRNNTGIGAGLPFGTLSSATIFGNIPVSISTNTVTFPDWLQGTFLIEYAAQCVAGANTANALTFLGAGWTNVTSITTASGTTQSLNDFLPTAQTNANIVFNRQYWRLTQATSPGDNRLQVGNGTYVGAFGPIQFSITQLPMAPTGGSFNGTTYSAAWPASW